MSKCKCGREIDDEEEVCGICRMGNIYEFKLLYTRTI